MKNVIAKLPLALSLLLLVCGCRLMTPQEMGMSEVSDSITVSKNIFGASFKVVTKKDTKHLFDLDSVTWNKESDTFELHNLHSDYNGSASSVVVAEAERMKYAAALAEMQVRYSDSQGRNAAMAIQAGGDALASVGKVLTAPFVGASVSNSSPLGTTTIRTGTWSPTTTQPAGSQ